MAPLPQTPLSGVPRPGLTLPSIDDNELIAEVVRQLSEYIEDAVVAPHTFEQLRTASVGHILRPLTKSLSDKCHHPDIVSALLISRWQFGTGEQDDRGVNEARGFACEIVAWRFLAHLPDSELIDYLLHEFPARSVSIPTGLDSGNEEGRQHSDHSRLLRRESDNTDEAEDELSCFIGLNALEIAAIADAKKFLSQNVVQKIVDDIWNGRIIFWESLSIHSKKKAKIYNKNRADPYCRLRVPKCTLHARRLFLSSSVLFLNYETFSKEVVYCRTSRKGY